MFLSAIMRAAAFCLLLAASGCSFLFVSAPPANHEQAVYISCTESNAVPALDAAWAGLNGLGAALALTSDAGTYENQDQAVIVGTAWLVVSGLAAREGFKRTKNCRSAKEQLAIRQSQSRAAPRSAASMFESSIDRAPAGDIPTPDGAAASLVRVQPRFRAHFQPRAPVRLPDLRSSATGDPFSRIEPHATRASSTR